MMNVTSEQKLLSSLNLPDCLKDRILCRVPPSPDHLVSSNTGKYEHHQDKERNHHRQQQQQQQKGKKQPTYVLYLPTVVLRKRHVRLCASHDFHSKILSKIQSTIWLTNF